MKLKKAVYIMAALVLALVLAACGADGEEKAVNEFRELMKQEQDILSQTARSGKRYSWRRIRA